MSASQSSASMSRHGSEGNCVVDPLDSFVDFSDYEPVSFKQSPSGSPASHKTPFARPSIAATASLMPTPQALSGPSHPYDLHKQQTGIPAGGVANTLAINNQIYGYGYSSGLATGDNFLDFNAASSVDNLYNLDMEFESPSDPAAFFYPEQALSAAQQFVNPSAIGGQEHAPTASTGGRVWPGMHQQQAALAKAQQQQKQQQLLIQQQRQATAAQQPKQPRKSNPPSDPIVEEKISQLLQSMRQNSAAASEDDDASTTAGLGHRQRKDEEDMDEDERLLASEEGKKLSSKERRQLRNKVSARAFRSRRKEYIGQLEGEIATKVNETSQLRAENKALLEENRRLSDLTRMLLSSPSFSGFLDTLSANPESVPQPQAAAAAPKVEQRPAESRVVRKDVNPYAAQQQLNDQQINFTMLPEQSIDYSMLDLGNTDFMYQPQVFAVTSLPEVTIDTSILSGKPTNVVGESFTAPASDDAKLEVPTIERAVVIEAPAPAAPAPVDEEFDADPAFALFADAPVAAEEAPESTEDLVTRLLESIVPEKASAHFELVVECSADESAAAMARVSRLQTSADAIMARLAAMTDDA